MTRQEYLSDQRYAKIQEKMELLNITDVSTSRQAQNGTIVWQLPIKYESNRFIEVASFKTGYVRNQNCGYSNYQLNKRRESEPRYYELPNGNYNKYTTRTCVLIPKEIDRLEYLVAYCLKNYYIKNANQVANGEYVDKWYHEHKLTQATSHTMNCKNSSQLYLENKVRNLENKLQSIIRTARH